MELKDRLLIARRYAGLTQQQLAEKAGIRQTTIAFLESGRNKTTSYIVQIATACEVSPIWLAEEKGPMLEGESAPKLTPKQAILLNHFEALTDEQQEELLRELQETKQRNEALFEALSRKKAEREAKV
jgi:transcriptional regulator with XRE-family HTH domain